jgi:hypothetical protein
MSGGGECLGRCMGLILKIKEDAQGLNDAEREFFFKTLDRELLKLKKTPKRAGAPKRRRSVIPALHRDPEQFRMARDHLDAGLCAFVNGQYHLVCNRVGYALCTQPHDMDAKIKRRTEAIQFPSFKPVYCQQHCGHSDDLPDGIVEADPLSDHIFDDIPFAREESEADDYDPEFFENVYTTN